MKGMFIFIKKELIESVKTYRILVLAAVLLLFAISSPPLAKFTPQLLNAVLGSDAAAMGLDIFIPDPVFTDAYLQFFKNVTQIPVPILIFIVSALIAGERSKGTYIIPLSKGLKRSELVVAKYVTVSAIWSVLYLLGVAIAMLYTVVLFPEAEVSGFFVASLMLLINTYVVIAIALFCSTIAKSTVSATMFAFLMWCAFSGTSFIPKVKNISPVYLSDNSMAIIHKAVGISDFIPALICSVVLIAVLLSASVLHFNRQEI